MNIPIENIYFLLCYAWDRLEERDIVHVDAADNSTLPDLLAQVLVSGTTILLKKGLDRYYIEHCEAIPGIKGKLDITATIKTNQLSLKRTVCIFDEFDYEILHNQILRTTLLTLLRVESLDADIRDQIKKIVIKFPPVKQISLSTRVFRHIRLNRNNYFYDFLLKVCEILYEILLINENEGDYQFKDFDRNEKKMAELFEAFVRNFYRHHLTDFHVQREYLHWHLEPLSEVSKAFLPQMETDITLKSSQRKIIIETKYKKETLQTQYDVEKIHSQNLYQLYAYLRNAEYKDAMGRHCEGILLYPTTTTELQLDYKFADHILKVRTLNLCQNWKDIESDLLKILD